MEGCVFKTITVRMNERAVLLRDGLPVRALAQGRHTFWTQRVDAVIFKLDEPVFSAPPPVLEMIPTDWYETVSLAAHQRALITRDERPILYLRPGLYRIWRVEGLKVRILSVLEPVPELTDELRAVIPQGEILDITIRQHERGLKYVQGRFEEILAPGRYVFWNHPSARTAVTVVDQRIQQLTISGQELMTRDKVTLRLTLTAEYAPADVAASVHTVADVSASLYLAVQLAAREFVAGVTLDALLEGRDELTRWLESQVVPRAKAFGVDVQRVGVKDIILPGEMKALLNRVIEAEKEALANVILRREEAAATRNMAQAAKVIAENPVLMRLKELEAAKEMAAKVGEIKLVVAPEALSGLLPKLDRAL